MNKICTSIEQSKKLIELGIDVNMADMKYMFLKEDSSKVTNIPFVKDNDEPEWPSDSAYDFIPCWSLATLMNMLPSEFTEKGEYSETTYSIDIRKYALTDDVDIYQIAYGNYHWTHGGHSWSDMVNSGQKEELIDAVFQMICWLKENNKI